MGWIIEDNPSTLFVSDGIGSSDYYMKSELEVFSLNGNIVLNKVVVTAATATAAAFTTITQIINTDPSNIDTPSINGVVDLVKLIEGYIGTVNSGGAFYGNVIVVTDLSDLPDPISGVILLADSTVYQVSGAVDIGSNRLSMGANTTIRGNSPAIDYLFSSTTSALINATGNFRIVECGFQASSGTIFNLSGTGAEICLMVGVRFFGTGGLGSVDQYDLFECNIGLFVGFTTGLTFTGANGSLILVDVEFFQTAGTPTSVNLGTATFNHVRFLGCAFTTIVGGTGLAVAASGANITSGNGGIITACNFAGAGANISGWAPLDSAWNVSVENENLAASDRYSPNGWGYYLDGETTPATQTITTTYSQILIDGLGSASESGYLPQAILGTGELWDTTNDKLTPISLGDSFNLRIDLEITGKTGGVGSLNLALDIGGGAAPTIVVVERVISIAKTAPFSLSVGFPIFALATFLTNGGQFFLSTDSGTATIASRAILIERTSSGA